MSRYQNVHLAGAENDDLYSGFNDYNPVLDSEVFISEAILYFTN